VSVAITKDVFTPDYIRSVLKNLGNFHFQMGGDHALYYAMHLGDLERFLIDLNRRGFPQVRFSDSRCWLGLGASMDGSASFDGFAHAAVGCD
jgi:hypothetical protein